jgi:hypothetical protein
MAANTEEATAMKRKKRFTIKMVALGFAVAAMTAPAAQAIPEGVHGSELRALQSGGPEPIISPDDRTIHGTNPELVTSPDDRAVHGPTSVEPTAQPVSAESGNRFEVSNGALMGIVLGLLGALMAAYTVHHVRKAGKLASV